MKNAMRRVPVGVAAVVLTTAGVALVAPAAQAAQGTAPCPSNYYCFYENEKYNATTPGWRLQYEGTTSGSFDRPPYAEAKGNLRDELSSIINNGYRTICIINQRTGRSDEILMRIAPYQDVLNAGAVNDKADKWKVKSGNQSC